MEKHNTDLLAEDQANAIKQPLPLVRERKQKQDDDFVVSYINLKNH